MANSRRLNPIWRALEVGNYRQALKLVKAAEAKVGASAAAPVLVALRAMSLQRLGRLEEAVASCHEFVALNCTDAAVLDSIKGVFKALGRLDLCTQTFETACKIKKADEQLMVGLYFAQLRVGNVLRQQQVALALFSKFDDEKYLRWAVLNMLLQDMMAPTSTSNAAAAAAANPSRLLQLAHMMLMRQKDAPDLNRGLLHVKVLQAMKEYEALVELLEGAFGSLWMARDESSYKLCLGVALSEIALFERSRDVFVSFLLHRNSDDWRVLRHYLNVQMRRHRRLQDAPEADDKDSVLLETRAFLGDLQHLDASKRGPLLAELELERLLFLQSPHQQTSASAASSRIPAMEGALLRYFNVFGWRRCFFSDVRRYSVFVCSSVLPQLRELSSQHDCNQRVQSHLSVNLLGRCLGELDGLSVGDLEARASAMYDEFRTSCLSDTDAAVDEREARSGEELALAVAHLLIDIHQITESRSYLMDAIYVLEDALLVCRGNFQYRLLLIRLYCHPAIGAFLCALRHFEALDVKQVQLDTLSHLVLDDAMRYCFFDKATALAGEISDYHEQHRIDCADWIILAYREDNLEQVLDFASFNERLHRSKRLQVAQALNSLCNLFNADKSLDNLTVDIEQELENLDEPTQQMLGELRCNADEELILLADSRLKRKRFVQLNRPSSFLVMDSWRCDAATAAATPAVLADDEGLSAAASEEKNRVGTEVLRFRYAVLSTTKAVIDMDASAIRSSLGSLRKVLHDLDLVSDVPSQLEKGATLAGVERAQWELCFLCLESSACVTEAHEATLSFCSRLATFQAGQEEVEHNIQRWAALHRQLEMQQVLLEHIVNSLRHALNQHACRAGTCVPALVFLLNFSASWSTIACQVWANQILSKRAYLRWRKSVPQLDVQLQDHVLQAEDDVIVAMFESRVVLRSFASKLSTTLLQLADKLRECINSARSPMEQLPHVESCLQAMKHPPTRMQMVRDEVQSSIGGSVCASYEGALKQLDRLSLILSGMKL